MRFSKLSRREVLAVSAGLACQALAPGAGAQAFPSKPIRLIVGFAPGGLTDALARIVAPVLAEKLGQPIIVEPKPGAAGSLSVDLVAKAPPDGHTLLFSSVGQIVVTPHTYPNLAVGPLTELTHLSMIGDGNLILAINADVPVQSFEELVALAKRQPGKLAYGDNGAGSNGHVATELLKLRTGTDIKPVHYRGIGALMPDLLSNQVQMGIFSPTETIKDYVASGRLRVVLVVGTSREAMFPEAPTAVEAGIKDLERCTNWFGLHAPKNTLPPIAAALEKAIADAVATQVVTERFLANNIAPMGTGPEAFRARIDADYRLFREVVAATNIRIE